MHLDHRGTRCACQLQAPSPWYPRKWKQPSVYLDQVGLWKESFCKLKFVMKTREKILNYTHSPFRLDAFFNALVSSWSAWYIRFQYAAPIIGPGVSSGGSTWEDADGGSGDEAQGREAFGGIEAKVGIPTTRYVCPTYIFMLQWQVMTCLVSWQLFAFAKRCAIIICFW